MKNEEYGDYIQDITESISDCVEFVKGMTFDDFVKDKKTVNAVIRSLEVIGEAARNIPEEIRLKWPEVPWKKMAGMRDKLIDEYFGVDLEIVWQVITEDMPPVKLPGEDWKIAGPNQEFIVEPMLPSMSKRRRTCPISATTSERSASVSGVCFVGERAIPVFSSRALSPRLRGALLYPANGQASWSGCLSRSLP